MSDKYVGKRIFYYDVLRVIAIFAIILCHTSGIYGKDVYTNLKIAIPSFCNIIGLVGVPLFFMLSGALLLNRNYELSDFFKRRFTRILYPAIFWMAITVLIFYFFMPQEHIMKFIFGQKYYTWFIWVMIGIYLIVPVINSFIKEYNLKGCEYFILIWLFTIILNTIHKYPFKRLELSYFAGFLGYVVLGYYLANHDFKINDLLLTAMGFISFVVFSAAGMIIRYNGIHLESGYQSITVVMASIGVFLMIKGLSNYLEGKSSKTYEKIKNGRFGDLIFIISAASYGMYFLNSIVIRFIKFYKPYPLKALPILYIVVIVLSLLVVVAVSKIPKMDKFSGMG